MQTPVQIEIEGVKKTAELQAAIDQQIVELERLFGRITVCRVALRGPGDRRQTGGHSVLDSASSIAPGTRVSYVEEIGVKGPQASTVKVLGKHSLRV